ncbi:hypothetical protein PanWU01x14_022650 [Parasponia andersonii]|uniref:Uncharacterized protein n=1 Tax=Parasponia andersonii TaxID=3476 RepID=A0A2P5DXA5_PARAD|nr:hypothetical protein PanWU01x14_022650 [Parasponia andersonii]
MSLRLKKKKGEEVGTEASPIWLSTPVAKTSAKKTAVKKSKEKEKKAAAKEEKIWSYETSPLLGQVFAIKETNKSIPRILHWSTEMAPSAEVLRKSIFSNPNLEIMPMTPMAEELEHPHINTIFELEKEKDETFVLKGKLFSNFCLNEKFQPDDDDEDQHIDGNMLMLSHVNKVQSFDGKAQGTSSSSELEVKARLHIAEEDLTSVKDEI